jgi:lipopolysaccharide transport system permease protein
MRLPPLAETASSGAVPDYLVVIEPGRRRLSDEIADLLHYRDLLYFLVRRDLSVRYKQTVLGVLWAVLQPLLTMVVFSVFLGNLAGVPSDGVPYPVFAYLGLLPWTYFSSAVTRGATSLVGHQNLLGKVYFPRVLIPLGAVLSALVDFVVAAAILVALMLYFGMVPAASGALLVPLSFLTALLALGVGMWLAALNVRYRDVQHATPFLMQIWMFATPVVYPNSLVPEEYRAWFHLNPMAGIIAAFRAAVLGMPIDWQAVSLSGATTIVFLALGIWQFRRMDRFFADVV